MSYSNILTFSLPGKCVDADEGLNPETWLLDQDVFVDCNAGDVGQDWIRHQEGNIVQWESALHRGYCIATEHDHNVVDPDGVGQTLSHAALAVGLGWSANSGAYIVFEKPSESDRLTVIYQNSNFFETNPLMSSANDEVVTFGSNNLDTNTTIDACTNGTVGLMHCENPATQWYDAGSRLLSLTCWKAGYSTALTVVGDDDDTLELKSVQVDDVLTTDSQFMFVESGSTSGGLSWTGWLN